MVCEEKRGQRCADLGAVKNRFSMMEPKVIDIHKLIELRAYEKWQYRMECNLFITIDRLGREREITALDDWLEAKEEVLREEHKDEWNGNYAHRFHTEVQ